MRVTYMISLNHDVPAQSITKLHAYKFAANPRNPAQTRTFPRNATRKFGLARAPVWRGRLAPGHRAAMQFAAFRARAILCKPSDDENGKRARNSSGGPPGAPAHHGAGEGGRGRRRGPRRARPTPAGEPRSAPRRGGFSRPGELPAG